MIVMHRIVVIALLASIALNISLGVAFALRQAPASMPAVVTRPTPTAPRADGDDQHEPPAFGSLRAAHTIASPAVAKPDAPVAAAKPRVARVDAVLIQDVLCDYAKSEAAQKLRKEADGIRDLVTSEETPNALQQIERNYTELFTNTLGLEANDGELQELASASAERELAFWRTVRDEAKKDPPDWGAATDAAVAFYRDVDEIVRK